MKKIETEEDRERRNKKNKTIIGLILIVLMVGSTAGYAISLFGGNKEEKTSSNQPTFNGQYWVINYGGKELAFSYSPEEVKQVPINIAFRIGDYQNVPVFIASDSEEIDREIAGIIGLYAERVQKACYGPCNESELPEKDCSSNLIVWNISEENNVYQQNRCVFIEGDIKAVDAFLYKILNII